MPFANPLRPSPVRIAVSKRRPGVRKRAIFTGGSFAPPGYDEIIHIISIHARDIFNFINQRENNLYEWRSGSSTDTSAFGKPNAYISTCFHPEQLKWGILYASGSHPYNSSGNINLYSFYEWDQMPNTHKPIYINPNQYMPYEITIARFGGQSNSAYGTAIVYFYRLLENQNQFVYQTNNLDSGPMKGIAFGLAPRYGIEAINSSGITRMPFQLFSQSNNRGANNIQDHYFGYAANATSTTLDLGLKSHSFPFPLREGILTVINETRVIDPLLRFAIVPHITIYKVGTTELEMDSSITVIVRCKGQ